MCGNGCCECAADGLCGQKLRAESPENLTGDSKRSLLIVGTTGIVAHVVSFAGGEMPFFIANGEGWMRTGGIGFIVPVFSSAFLFMGLVAAVLLTAGDSGTSYQTAAVLSTIALSVHCVILMIELLMFWFASVFGSNLDYILWLLLIKNILCVATEGAVMVVAMNARGALKNARAAQQQSGGQQMMPPRAGVQSHVPTAVPMAVPTAVPTGVVQGVAVPARVV